MVGTPIDVPLPSTVSVAFIVCLPPAAWPGACGGRASALVTSTYAMRNSYRQFCRKVSSAEVRLPLVFSCSRPSVSMVWRAPIRSMRGCPPSSCIMPSCIMALM